MTLPLQGIAVGALVIIGAIIGYLAGAIFSITVYPSGILIVACIFAGSYAGLRLGRVIFDR